MTIRNFMVLVCLYISTQATYAQFTGTNPSTLSDNGLITGKLVIGTSSYPSFTNARRLTLHRKFLGLPAQGAPLHAYTTGMRFTHRYSALGTNYTDFNWDIAVTHNTMLFHSLNTNTTIMNLKPDGKVGIGLNNPDATLHVKNFNSTKIDAHLEGFTLIDGAQASLLLGAQTGVPYGEWGIEYNPGARGLNFWKPSGASAGHGNYYLFINDNGKVSIGLDPTAANTYNGDYNLYVGKGILTEKVKVALKNTADWADYVFADNYQLMPLSDVDKFVKEHKHLPGVPSAEEVQKEGIDVAKMDAKLLEKIEELTLYMIQLKEENEALKAEVEQLKTKIK